MFSPFLEHWFLLLPAQNPNEHCIPGEMTEGTSGVIDVITGGIRCCLIAFQCEMCLHRDDRRDLRDDRRDLRDDRRDDRIRLKPLFDICILVIVSLLLLLYPILIFPCYCIPSLFFRQPGLVLPPGAEAASAIVATGLLVAKGI